MKDKMARAEPVTRSRLGDFNHTVLLVMALFCIVMVLLALAGDVHPNPGPGLSECVTSRSYTILCTDQFQVTRPHSNS